MKSRIKWLPLVLALLTLPACGRSVPPTGSTLITEAEQTLSSEPELTESVSTQPLHSDLYIQDIPVEDVLLYFNEVCLDSEFINSGDPSYVQKWTEPIYYTLEGDYTDADVAAVDAFANWINSVGGFPGIYLTEDPTQRNLRICFCDQEEMLQLMGSDFANMDGAVTFWYLQDEIYDAIICCRTDLDQQLRNSVILEELYNCMGPIQDTALRPDSIIYQEFSQNQWLSPMDTVLMKLLYHPQIRPGMDAQQCEAIIRTLYY